MKAEWLMTIPDALGPERSTLFWPARCWGKTLRNSVYQRAKVLQHGAMYSGQLRAAWLSNSRNLRRIARDFRFWDEVDRQRDLLIKDLARSR